MGREFLPVRLRSRPAEIQGMFGLKPTPSIQHQYFLHSQASFENIVLHWTSYRLYRPLGAAVFSPQTTALGQSSPPPVAGEGERQPNEQRKVPSAVHGVKATDYCELRRWFGLPSEGFALRYLPIRTTTPERTRSGAFSLMNCY